MSKYLDSNGLLYFWQKLKTLLAGKVDTVSGKGLSTNDYTTAERDKLTGIESGANRYVLPPAGSNALGGIKVGENLTITEDGTLSATGGGSEYILPTASTTTKGGVKVGANLSMDGDVLNATDTTYNPATTSANGLMSSTDKSKLDAFQAAANYALKTDISGVYKYKGSVATYAQLPTTGNTPGDVWDVQSNNQNYAWTSAGTWDPLGEVFQITSVTNGEIDDIMET